MFAQVHIPQVLPHADLDAYLSKGWFRMGQTIFTTNFLRVRNEIFSTIWLRMKLDEYEADNTQIKLFKKNAGFRVTINPATLTHEKEDLYAVYKESVPFQASSSLEHLLLSGTAELNSIYTTYEVTVRDGDKLIACGFFDIGGTSAQGITSFYDPAYKKYSLGKYLIYLKIQYCKNVKLHYFYPGYFVPGNPYFDYKLTIGRSTLQFFSVVQEVWLSLEKFSNQNILVQVMHDRLAHVHTIVAKNGFESHILKNEFFDVNLMPQLRDTGLFDFPVFLFFGAVDEDNFNPIIVFDPRDGLYHLMECIPVWKPVESNPDQTFYSIYFLKVKELDSSASGEEIVLRWDYLTHYSG
ncbi:hypothetical protein BH10BAC4_BH10BAC4_17470 [soil metagenome]